MQPFAPKSDAVKFDTCFFEQYAQISLSAILGGEFDSLENRDRPDLQSADRHSLGIEVTRAMEESKSAAQEMLRDVAGITPGGDATSPVPPVERGAWSATPSRGGSGAASTSKPYGAAQFPEMKLQTNDTLI